MKHLLLKVIYYFIFLQCASFKPGDKAIKIENLMEGKRYTFRIKAVNSAGESEGLESRSVSVQKPSNPPMLDAAVVEKLKEVQNFKSGKDIRLKVSGALKQSLKVISNSLERRFCMVFTEYFNFLCS